MKKAKSKTINNNQDYIQDVYTMVGSIPKGKVTTYAQIAIAVNGKLKRKKINKRVNPRSVGFFCTKTPIPKTFPVTG